jgi:hypothetical protein
MTVFAIIGIWVLGFVAGLLLGVHFTLKAFLWKFEKCIKYNETFFNKYKITKTEESNGL